MDIQEASNTPTLVNQIIGSNTFSETSATQVNNQIFTINSDTSSYVNNSTITVTNTEIYYDSLGLLNPPEIVSSSSNKVTLFESDHKTSTLSILSINSDLNSMHNEISSYVNDSTTSPDYVSKETYLLLSIQSLIDFVILLCTTFDESDKFKTVKNIDSSLFHLSHALKLMSQLIGQQYFSFNYGNRISDKLTTSLIFLRNEFDEFTKNNSIQTNNDILKYINTFLNDAPHFDILYTNSKSLYLAFADYIIQTLDCINSFLKLLLDFNKFSVNKYQILLEIIKYSSSSVSLSYSDIKNNYKNIINNIKYALSNSTDITFSNIDSELLTSFNNNLLVNKSFSKSLTDNTDKKSTAKNIDIPASTPTENTTEQIELVLSFYVCNLKINVSGTIGSQNFTGYIAYPSTYNLSYFEINEITVNTELTIPSNITHFNLTQCLNPQLQVTSVTATALYSTSSPSSFNANINLSLLANGEVLATAIIPIVIAK